MENEITVIEQTALTWPEKAEAITITDQASYDLAATTLREIAEIEKQIRAHHTPMKTAAHNAHKAAVTAEKKYLDPLTKAKGIIRKGLSVWEVEQWRIAEEVQRKAREEAEKKEEDERLKRATEAETAGKSEAEVDEILDTPKPVTVAPVKPTFEPAPGMGTQNRWKAEVTEIKELCKAVADGEVPIECILPNMPFLNSAVRATKEHTKIPGVKAVKETTTVMR